MRRQRIARGVAAALFDKSVIALMQLLAVPVLATRWGLDVYGGWVLLSTLPSFLGISDFGFATAAGTRMTMLVATERRDEAAVVFQSAWAVILASSAAMIALALAATWAAPPSFLPHGFAAGDARLTLSLLLLYGIVALQGSILIAGFRCAGRFATAVTWAGVSILIENGAMIATVLLGGRPVSAAAAMLAGRTASLLVQTVLLHRQVPWLRLGLSKARRTEARAAGVTGTCGRGHPARPGNVPAGNGAGTGNRPLASGGAGLHRHAHPVANRPASDAIA